VKPAVAAGLAVQALCLALIAGPQLAPADPSVTAAEQEVIGRSVQGRPITAVQLGDPAADRVALIVGVIHGDELAGLRVIDALRQRAATLQGIQLWLISTVNPDGGRAGERKNAHGVDLNRNFPYRWRGGEPHSNGYYPGPRPASEPETRAAMAFIERIQPDVSIWYHQPWGAVLACHGEPALALRYAKLVGMRTSCRGRRLRGTAISWEQHVIPGSTAFVVEFPDGKIKGRTAQRHAGAAITIASGG
jgi:murein peptide amidase A